MSLRLRAISQWLSPPTGAADFHGQRCNQVTIGNFFKHLLIYEMAVLLPTPVSASLPLTQRCVGVHFKQVGSTFANILEMYSCRWMSSVIWSAEKKRSSQTESSTTQPVCVAPSSTGSVSEVALCPWLTPSVYQPSSLPIVQQIFSGQN